MSNRFDAALLERERGRMALSEALDSKYDSERRRSAFVKLFVVSVISASCYYAAQGAYFVAEHTKPPDLVQVKKQLNQSDQLLIGTQNKIEEMPKGAPGGFEKEVPINLAEDFRKKPKKPAPSRIEYGEAPPRLTLELKQLAQARSRKGPIDCGRYRVMNAADTPKLPPRRAARTVPDKTFYAQLKVPPARLAADGREFPDGR